MPEKPAWDAEDAKRRYFQCDEDSPHCQKKIFPPVFTFSRDEHLNDEFAFEVGFENYWQFAYFETARHLVVEITEGRLDPELEGIVALYVFRHYLELALKRIILRSRFVTMRETAAEWHEVETVRCSHSLERLWTMVKTEAGPKVPPVEWKKLDIAFIEDCIATFHRIDPSGQRFRYHSKVFGFEKDWANERPRPRVRTDFGALLAAMDHVFDVFNYLDARMTRNYLEVFLRRGGPVT